MTNRKNVQIIKWAKMHFLGNIWWPPLFPNSPMRYFLLYSVESPDLKSGIIVTTVWKKLGPILQNGRHGIEIDRIMGKRDEKPKIKMCKRRHKSWPHFSANLSCKIDTKSTQYLNNSVIDCKFKLIWHKCFSFYFFKFPPNTK